MGVFAGLVALFSFGFGTVAAYGWYRVVKQSQRGEHISAGDWVFVIVFTVISLFILASFART